MKGLIFLLFIISFSCLKAEEGGYTNKFSYNQGDSISFFISTKKIQYSLVIFNLPDTLTSAATFSNISGGERITPDSSYLYGCNWPLSLKISSTNFSPGVYEAHFPTSRGTFKIVFFIKPASPGSLSKILVVPSTNTWQAYNPFGGKSLYNFNSTDSARSYKVSFLRPSAQIIGYPEFIRSEELIFRWLSVNNIGVEYAVDYDLHSNPSLLNNYKVVIIAGHSEYWSYEERSQIQRFVDRGGKLIVMSGNTCWFQVRFENSGRTMVCYKNNLLDPLYGIADSLVTNNWALPPINNPENKLLGVGFLAGGYVNNNTRLPASLGYGDYAALNTWHWIYNGTNLHEGDEFGYSEGIVGNEVDGALYNWQNGIPVVTGQDGSPKNYLILGISPAESDYTFTTHPHATMGIYYNNAGGAVFNSATINWGPGLKQGHPVEQITKNVLSRFLKNTFPPVIISWSPSNVSSKVINHENISLNDRNFFSLSAKDYILKISAVNESGNTLNFSWELNGDQISNDSVFTFNYKGVNATSKATCLTSRVFNNTDTTIICWNFFNSQLAFYDPPVLKPGFTNVKIPVFNPNNSQLQFMYSGPSGLSIDNNGILTGNVPENYTIRIIVKNNQNLSDTLVLSKSITEIPIQSSVPRDYTLFQNYPNPFNPSTNIKYVIPEGVNVSLKVYDILGREITTLVNSFQAPGFYDVLFDGSNLPSGIYFYRLTAGHFSDVKKFILEK